MTNGLPVLRRQESVMGTVASLELHPPFVDDEVLALAFARLHADDARFSPYRPDSELSRLRRGEVTESAASEAMRFVLARCDGLARSTSGYFDARRCCPDGVDPSGFVKGWSIEGAAAILENAGARNFILNVGGDVVVRGGTAGGSDWRVGIRHPDRRDRLAAVVAVRDRAIATSGLYERGGHIRDPHTGETPTELRSITVIGPTLELADAYATAAFAMGEAGAGWVARQPGHGVFAVTARDRTLSNDLFQRCIVPFDGPPDQAPFEVIS